MASSIRQLPPNYAAYSALDFGRKGRLRTLWSYGSFLVWVVCGGLMFWIVVALRPDAQQGLRSLGWVDVLISVVVLVASIFGGVVLLAMLHEGAHQTCYWLFTGERPRISSFEEHIKGYGYIAPPDCYLTKPILLVVALTPLIAWLLVSAVILTFVPVPAIYWIILPLALTSAICVGDVIMMAWALRQPRDALFNDQGPVTTAYLPTI